MVSKYSYVRLEEDEEPKNRQARKPSPSRAFVLTHLCLLVLYAGIFVGCASIYRQQIAQSYLIYSPLRDFVTYSTVEYDSSVPDEFGGPPSLALDAAWQKILLYNNAVVQKEDLRKINRTSVMLRDKSGYLAGIDVFHQLHCLNYIREVAHRDYYKVEASLTDRLEHADHCIDTLREVLQCHGDISLVKFDWTPDHKELVQRSRQTSTCRDWNPIMDWAKEHTPSHAHGPILEHPTLGIIESESLNETMAVSR